MVTTGEIKGTIRVLIADDHGLFRQGISQMLRTDPCIEVVGEAGDGAEALELAREEQPDLIFLDIEMPLMSGEQALERLLSIPSSPRILILSMHTEDSLVRRLLAQGASGYVAKSASIEELLAAAHSAVQCPRSPEGDEVTVVIPRNVLESAEEGESPLSTRELEILLLVARGFSNQQIASALRISGSTVKRHLGNIYPKMEVGSRGEAVSKALSEKWLTVQQITATEY
jgi:DNA-binding NarL/FixJ family response regulator